MDLIFILGWYLLLSFLQSNPSPPPCALQHGCWHRGWDWSNLPQKCRLSIHNHSIAFRKKVAMLPSTATVDQGGQISGVVLGFLLLVHENFRYIPWVHKLHKDQTEGKCKRTRGWHALRRAALRLEVVMVRGRHFYTENRRIELNWVCRYPWCIRLVFSLLVVCVQDHRQLYYLHIFVN